MRRVLAVLFALAVISGGVIYLFPEWTRAPAQPAYRFAKTDRGPILAAVTATGTINPTTTVIVSSQLSGQVVEVLADYNSEVAAGQVVVRLNTDQVRAKLDAARADLEQMRATRLVQQAQIQRVHADTEKARAAQTDVEAQIVRNESLLAETERTAQRQADLKARGVTTDAAFENARTQRDAQKAALDSARAQLLSAKAALLGLAADLDVAKAQLQAGTAQVSQREAAVRQIEVDLRNSEIRSPVSGTVVQRSVELGQTVAASMTAPTLFLIADDLRRMEIAANIDETDVGRIRAGQRVSFTVNAYPGRTFDGTVKLVRLGSQTLQNVVIYTTIISVENPRKELLPGLTANLRIETDRRDDAVRVPNAALRWRPAGDAGAPVPEARDPMAGSGAREDSGDGSSRGERSGRAEGAGGRGRMFAELVATMKAELSLSAEQEKEIDTALSDARNEMRATRGAEPDQAARREAARLMRTQVEDRLALLLTPEQRVKFDDIRKRLTQNGAGQGGVQNGRVYTMGSDGKAAPVTVRLGVTDGGMTEILSGLDAGRDVIIGGGPRPADAPAPAAGRPPGAGRFGF